MFQEFQERDQNEFTWRRIDLAQIILWSQAIGVSDEHLEFAIVEMIQGNVVAQFKDRRFRFVSNPQVLTERQAG